VIRERAIKVESVIYSLDLHEYPSTLENGVAYIVNVENISKEQIDIICETLPVIRTAIAIVWGTGVLVDLCLVVVFRSPPDSNIHL